jgi:hypothetical protein
MPQTISEARARLPAHVRRFREQGLDAEPVILGDRRHPDAALLPYETFRLQIMSPKTSRSRSASESVTPPTTANRTTLAEAAYVSRGATRAWRGHQGNGWGSILVTLSMRSRSRSNDAMRPSPCSAAAAR